MRRWLCGVGLALWGCGSNDVPKAPNIGDCLSCTQTNPGGTIHPATEAGTEPDTGVTEPDANVPGDGGSVSVPLTLGMLSDPAFAESASAGSIRVVVSAFGPAGGVVDTGSVILPVKLDGVALGPNWFAVKDVNANPMTLAPTLQPVAVGTSAVALSALNAGQLAITKIDNMIPGSPLGGASLVLVFRKAGRSVPGIGVTGNPAGSIVAYYTGNGAYQTVDKGTTVTGAESTVIVRDLPAAAQFPTLIDLSLKCSIGASTFDVLAKLAQTYVTWMVVEVP